jgi:chromosome segregation ATPase
MQILKDLWAKKWFKFLTMGVLALLLVFLFVRYKKGQNAEYWHGMFDAKVEIAEGLGYTVDSLNHEVAKLKTDSAKKIGELQGQIDSLQTVASNQDQEITGKDGKITSLEAKVASAKTEHDEVLALRPLVAEQKSQIELLKTQVLEGRKLGDLKDQKYAVLETAWVNLNIDYEKAIKGWAAEKDARAACAKALASLQIQVGGIKLERTIERLVIVAGGAYVLLKK